MVEVGLASKAVEVIGATAEEEGDVEEFVDEVNMRSTAGGPLSPEPRAVEWGSIPRSIPDAGKPATLVAVYVATAKQPAAPAAGNATTLA